MLGLVKKFDRFFEARDAVLRPAKKPICSGHIAVDLSQHEWSGAVADNVHAEVKVLEGLFAIPLLMITKGDLTVGLGHPEPISYLPKIIQRLFGIVSADRTFVQFAVNTCKAAVDGADQVSEIIFLGSLKSFFKQRDRLRMIINIVI